MIFIEEKMGEEIVCLINTMFNKYFLKIKKINKKTIFKLKYQQEELRVIVNYI